MSKGTRNRAIRRASMEMATKMDQPERAGGVARRSRKDLTEMRRKGLKIRFHEGRPDGPVAS